MTNSLLQHLRKITLGLMASAFAVSAVVPAALACESIDIAGVQLNNGFKSQGAETTFLSSDPVYGYYYTYELQPATRAQYPSVGVNFPAINEGNLKNLGKFQSLLFYYDSFNGVADAGLRYYAQDNNGFLHTATSTSYEETSGNGAVEYYVYVYANQFSPTVTSKLTNLNLRYANSHAGTIYFLDPYIYGNNDDAYADFGTTNDTAFNN